MKNSGLANFHPGNVFSICTSQFHPPKNGLKVLKLVLHVSKMALKKWNTNLRFETFRPEKQD